MRTTVRSGWAIIAATLALALVATTASAQNFNNPPCATVTVNNLSPCAVNVNIVTIPAGIWPPFLLPVGGVANLPVPLNGFVTVTGVIDINGVFFPTTPPPPPAGSPCGPTDWWTPIIPMGPGCNVTYCLDPLTCTINIW